MSTAILVGLSLVLFLLFTGRGRSVLGVSNDNLFDAINLTVARASEPGLHESRTTRASHRMYALKSLPLVGTGLALIAGAVFVVVGYCNGTFSMWNLTVWAGLTAIAIIVGTKSGRKFFRTDSVPPRFAAVALGLVFFVLLTGFYLDAAYARHAANEMDKVLPIPSQIYDGFVRVAFEEDKRTGELRLWADTAASLWRFSIAMVLICFGVLLGVNMGIYRWLEALCKPFMTFFDKIPALALLPILFVIFAQVEVSNPGEWWKISLLVIGVFPTIALDAYQRAKAVPQELIFKAQSLGATEQEVCYRVVLPQIMPDVLDTIRLNIKTVVNLLIAAEAVEASVGLGYRIFVVRRYMAMDVIIPYVLWMTVLFFVADYAIQYYIRAKYPWRTAAA